MDIISFQKPILCCMAAYDITGSQWINLLFHERQGSNLKCAILQHILMTDILSISNEIALSWMNTKGLQ